MNRNEEPKKVLKELYIGIAICVAAFMLIGIIVMRPVWMFIISIIIGGVGAGVQAYGIYDTLDRVLELPEKNAKGFATAKSMLRLVLCGVLMIGAVLIHWTCFVGVSVGLLTLKISALINPLIRKILYKDLSNNMIDGVEDTLDIEENNI